MSWFWFLHQKDSQSPGVQLETEYKGIHRYIVNKKPPHRYIDLPIRACLKIRLGKLGILPGSLNDIMELEHKSTNEKETPIRRSGD